MNKPKIRFSGYTEAWEQRKLSELLEVTSEKNTKGQFTQDDILACSLGTELDKKTIFFGLRSTEESVKSYRVVNIGDVIYTKSPIKGYPNGIVRTCKNTDGIVPSLYCVYREKDNISIPIDTRFIQSYLEDKTRLDGYLSPLVNVGARNNVNITDKGFLEGTIMLPKTKEEQIRIVDTLTTISDLITLHQRKCDQTKKLKKYMLQKMFPQNGELYPEIRFEGFTKAWEQRKLLEFGKATGGTSIESEFSEDGIYKVISIGSYSEDSVYRDQGIRAVRSDKTANRILNKGDITMILNDKTASGNIIGRVLLIEESGVYVYNQRTERIEVDNSNYDSQFIYTMLNAPEIRDKIIKQSQGNTQIYVNWTTVSQTDYLVPQLSEQRRIGEYFSNLDNLITLHQWR